MKKQWRNSYDDLCLKQNNDFILKFPINGSFCWGTQNYYMSYTQDCFFTSCKSSMIICLINDNLTNTSSTDEILVMLSLMEEIIKDANSMWISFSVKQPQTFLESWMSFSNMFSTISNMYTYTFNPKLVIKHKLKVIIRNQKIKGTFIRGLFFLNEWGYFSLD